jgi:radical S-adenosyl methionine domain-containing protein 2
MSCTTLIFDLSQELITTLRVKEDQPNLDFFTEQNNKFGRDVSYAEVVIDDNDKSLLEYRLFTFDEQEVCHGQVIHHPDLLYWRYQVNTSGILNDPFVPDLQTFVDYYYIRYLDDTTRTNQYLTIPIVIYMVYPSGTLESIRYSLIAGDYQCKPLVIVSVNTSGFLRIIHDYQGISNKVTIYPTEDNDFHYLTQDFGNPSRTNLLFKPDEKTSNMGQLNFSGFQHFSVQYNSNEVIEGELQKLGFLPDKTRDLIQDETIFLKYIPTVNYHLIKPCNMKCTHCFSDFEEYETKWLPIDKAKSIINEIARIKTFKKLNFSGGEPTIYPDIVDLVRLAKGNLMETSLVSNGFNLLRNPDMLKNLQGNLDILALSIDSFHDDTNMVIGRHVNGRVITKDEHILLADKCNKLGIKVKVNTVVTKNNCNEIMADYVAELKPIRWKVLRMLEVSGQNDKALSISPTDEEFQNFVLRNRIAAEVLGVKVVTEDTQDMTGSYLMIGPDGRFFNNVEGKHNLSKPILDVGIIQALSETPLSRENFFKRGGDYSCE